MSTAPNFDTTNAVASDDDFDFSIDYHADIDGFCIQDLLNKIVLGHYAILRANRAIVGMTFADPGYGKARAISDAAVAYLSIAKWKTGGITHSYNGVTRSKDPAVDGHAAIKTADEAIRLAQALEGAARDPQKLSEVSLEHVQYDDHGTECLRIDGIPIVPTICPVVVLVGSSYDMGHQYASQVIDIYGDFNFRRFAELNFDAKRLGIMKRWERELEKHTPELIDFCKGWAAGCKASGLDMSYEHVLHILVGCEEPVKSIDEGFAPFAADTRLPVAMYFASASVLQQVHAKPSQGGVADGANPVETCSGACAWGSATADGKLKTASVTDHDCWMQATIVAYPDDGFPYIYTPFTVTGWIPGMANQRFGGHPGMNGAGVAYVHHGGEAHMMEPEESWGYGPSRGAATLHTLRYAKTAQEARDIQFAMPIGDVGSVLGGAGGQWADHDYGCIIESRELTDAKPMGLVREGTPTRDGEVLDILYAGNSSLHPDASGTSHGYAPGELQYDVERGWYTDEPTDFTAVSIKRYALRLTALGGERPRTFYRHFVPANGRIDHDWMAKFYRTGTPGYPAWDEWEDGIEDIRLGKRKLAMSPAKRLNAFTALMEPDTDGQGLYHACIGPLSRDLPPGGSGHEYYYFDETNTYWTLRLAHTPEELAEDASERAEALIQDAAGLIEETPDDYAGLVDLNAWLTDAENAIRAGRIILTETARTTPGDLARAVRRFTRAQVRARQVIDTLRPPESLNG